MDVVTIMTRTSKPFASAGYTRMTAQRGPSVSCHTALRLRMRPHVFIFRTTDAAKMTVALHTFTSILQRQTATHLDAWGTVRKATPAQTCMHMSVQRSPIPVSALTVTSAGWDTSIVHLECGKLIGSPPWLETLLSIALKRTWTLLKIPKSL